MPPSFKRLYTLLVSAGFALAANIISPKPGETLDVALKISVVLSSDARGYPGAELVEDLASTNFSGIYGSAVYSAQVVPWFLHRVPPTGKHTLHIVETYVPYGCLCQEWISMNIES
ncbi:hypothetical protein C8J57DRAFT_1255038 [Mycena rebaudengoi]|nr:hypothetical protein C8J57DRAFT_1255038 [Mycena rebaudengoi]